MSKDTLAFLEEYQDKIIEIYKEQALYSIRDIKKSPHYDPNIGELFFDVVRKNWVKYGCDYWLMHDDILFCSDEIMYFNANLYLYCPYINNPFEDATHFGDGIIYPNYENLATKRYNMFASIVVEKLYNFWDRMGDLMASFFPDIWGAKKNIYFGSAVDKIPKEFQKNEYYQWLLDFKDNGFEKLNEIRIRVVHYNGISSLSRKEHLNAGMGEGAILDWDRQRRSWPDYYKEHIEFTIIGFQKILHLLRIITESIHDSVE